MGFTLQLSMQHVIFLYNVPSTSWEDVVLHPQVSHFGKEAFPCVKEEEKKKNSSFLVQCFAR